jgi:hypothetical protein
MVGGAVLTLLPPVRWLVKKFVFAPGSGPSVEAAKNDSVVFRAVAEPDPPKEGKRAFGQAEYHGSMYTCKFGSILTPSETLSPCFSDILW